MKSAIMQPYFLPYLGYWQMINIVDEFILFDDVNFIKKGYIHRNTIIVNNSEYLFRLELINASQNRLINEIKIGDNRNKILKTIELAYKKKDQFSVVFPIIESIFNSDEEYISKFIKNSLQNICDYLDISTLISNSSDIDKNDSSRGQDKIIEICKLKNTKQYINAIGGKDLYSNDIFKQNHMELSFIDMDSETLKMNYSDLNLNLSIIDILMNYNKETIKKMLDMYKLV